jgi:hypothetical protein
VKDLESLWVYGRLGKRDCLMDKVQPNVS